VPSQRKEQVVKKNYRYAIGGILIALTTFWGCDFFKSSGPEGGVNPFITNLSITPSAVGCSTPFNIKFDYLDPQEDIEQLIVVFSHELGFSFEAGGLWNQGEVASGGRLDLSVPGTATYTYTFDCALERRSGNYSVTVQLEDRNGHLSNIREDEVRLN
jgi:hypothetical protein